MIILNGSCKRGAPEHKEMASRTAGICTYLNAMHLKGSAGGSVILITGSTLH